MLKVEILKILRTQVRPLLKEKQVTNIKTEKAFKKKDSTATKNTNVSPGYWLDDLRGRVLYVGQETLRPPPQDIQEAAARLIRIVHAWALRQKPQMLTNASISAELKSVGGDLSERLQILSSKLSYDNLHLKLIAQSKGKETLLWQMVDYKCRNPLMELAAVSVKSHLWTGMSRSTLNTR